MATNLRPPEQCTRDWDPPDYSAESCLPALAVRWCPAAAAEGVVGAAGRALGLHCLKSASLGRTAAVAVQGGGQKSLSNLTLTLQTYF